MSNDIRSALEKSRKVLSNVITKNNGWEIIEDHAKLGLFAIDRKIHLRN